MAKNWGLILPVKAAAWGIPDRALTELADAAEAALTTAKNETTRTPVATAACKTAFKALKEAMRDLKKRYFFVPPLTEADLIGLGLKLPDPVHTPSGDPKAHAAAEIFLAGRHELGIRIVYVDGDPEDKANKGFRVWYKALAPGKRPRKPRSLASPGLFSPGGNRTASGSTTAIPGRPRISPERTTRHPSLLRKCVPPPRTGAILPATTMIWLSI
jgi:hypothetical protein